MALAIESGFPVNGFSSGPGSAPSVTITTAGASFLVAVIVSGASAPPADPTLGASGGTGSGNVGSWTKQVGRISGTSSYCWIYTAASSGALTSVLIGAAGGWNNADSAITVYSFTGAASSQPGTANGVNGTSGAAQKSFTTTGSNSIVVWGGIDIGGSSVTAATTNTVQGTNTHAGDQYFYGRYDGQITAGTYTIGTSAPTNADWVISGIEVLEAGGGSYSGSDTEQTVATDNQVAYGPVRILGSFAQSTAFQENAFQVLGGSASGETNPYSRAQPESATLSDSGDSQSVKASAQPESTTVTDTVSVQAGRQSTEAETSTPGDATVLQAAKQSSQSESTTLDVGQDSALTHTAGNTYSDTATESVTLTDATLEAAAKQSTESESSTLTEGTSLQAAKQSTESESATLTDSATAAAAKQSTESESTTLSDSAATATGKGATESESTTLTDSATKVLVGQATQGETATATETFVPASGTLGGVGWTGSTSLANYPKTGNVTDPGGSGTIVDLDADNSDGHGGTPAARFSYALGLLSSNSRVLLRTASGASGATSTVTLGGVITRSTNWSTNLVSEGDGKSYKQFFAYGDQRVLLDTSGVDLSGATEGPLLLNGQKEHWKGFEITGGNLPAVGSSVAGIITIHGSDNKVEDFLIHANGGGAAAYLYGANNIVQDTVGWDNGRSSGAQDTHSPDGMNSAASGAIFVRNVLLNPRDDGIDLYGGTNNKVLDCVSYGAGWYPGNASRSGDGTGYKMGLTGPTSGNNQNTGSIAVEAAAIAFSLYEVDPYPVLYDHITDGGPLGADGASIGGRGTGAAHGGDSISNSIYNSFTTGGNGTGTPTTSNNYTSTPHFADTANGDYSITGAGSDVGKGASTNALQLLKDNWFRLLAGDTATQSETSTLSESSAVAARHTSSQAESVTTSDGQDSAKTGSNAWSNTQGDTATCSDAFGVAQAYAKTYAEAVTLAESMASAASSPHTGTAYSNTMAESVSVSDAMSATTIAAIANRLRIWNGSAWV